MRTYFENSFVLIAVVVSNFNTMQPLDRDLIHLVGDRVIAVSGQTIDAGPDQKVGSNLLCRAEKLVDVALAIDWPPLSGPGGMLV